MLTSELQDVTVKMLRADLVERAAVGALLSIAQKDSMPLVCAMPR